MSEKAERLDVRLTDEEKKRLAELAKQRNMSMTELVRMWIMSGDVVHVLAEQLQDITNDFAKWHVLENRNTNIGYLGDYLQGRTGAIEDEGRRIVIYAWLEFYSRSFELIKDDVLKFDTSLAMFIKPRERKEKKVLVGLIKEFTRIITLYNRIYVWGFIDILRKIDEKTKQRVGGIYNDEFRTRYNEIASKYEDFLKRAQRELGEGLQQDMPRAKEFRAEE